MSAERMTILKMLEEGKITAAEAERLLNALGEQQKSDEEDKDIFDALGEGLDRAFKAVQNMDLGKIVDSTVASVGEKVEAVQRSDVRDMVSEFIAGQAPVETQTLNGSVAVSLPADFAGQLEAQTSNGRVHCDFPVIQAGPGRKNRLAGPLGKGGETLVKLKTLNGNIDLHKLADAANA